DRDALVDTLLDDDERILDERVAGRRARDLERADDVHAGADERRERAREARHPDLEDDLADPDRRLYADAVPDPRALLGLFEAQHGPDAEPNAREDDVPVALQEVRHPDHDLRELREVAAELLEDVHEDRDEEHEH